MMPTGMNTWTGLHCYLFWPPEHVEEFLTGTLAPFLDELRSAGRIADWFFLRYWEGGPHLRVRLRLPSDDAEWLAGKLSGLVAAMPYPTLDIEADRFYAELGGLATAATAGWHAHGEVVPTAYEPETERYGGVPAMAAAERVFCRSSEVAVAVIAATGTRQARLTAAAELAMATATALGLDRQRAAHWLRMHAASWRWTGHTGILPAVASHARAARVLAAQAQALGRRWTSVAERVSDEPGTAVSAWAAAVRDARKELEDDPAQPAAGRWLWVWGSQLHMVFNRLGLSPEEERSLCRLVAGAAVSPDGIAGYFTDGADAPDRRYQEASKFLPGASDQRPRWVMPAPPSMPALPARRRVELPSGPPAATGLADALRQRQTSRGRLTGLVSATDLGTLLWTAQGVVRTSDYTAPDGSEHPVRHRPYPSAGAKYAARLCVIALDVAGLPAGCYHVDAEEQALWWGGPAPSIADLEGMSSFFNEATIPFGGTSLGELPAMLALHVRLDALRARYGLRALRFALTEAGHLAQNLSLVAAATGLSLGMIGGFYDDVVSEVLGLDSSDDMPVYLMPLGRDTRNSPD